MAGGNPASGAQVENGFYPTPPSAVTALVRWMRPHFYGYNSRSKVHEFACGDGAMSKVLINMGHDVVSTDLVDRGFGSVRDFFSFTEDDKPADVAITNPAFSLAEQTIRHAREVMKIDVLALLLKSTFWQAAERLPLWNEHRPVMSLPLSWRLDFQQLGKPTMDCTWFIWAGANEAQIMETDILVRPAEYPRKLDRI